MVRRRWIRWRMLTKRCLIQGYSLLDLRNYYFFVKMNLMSKMNSMSRS